ncbi:RNA polymerase sigma factor [Paraliomyxa miuraensis]|uniref:RNA polymerase sigma factor n=1 Tax=Paraliomyxa miuraensis TaxID=376150 RepID=UPI00225C1C55|nr:sigma-70 family RNA polymerase sigma factor [Paraliomyxa miuraensis]MCX4244884.1 sigma-70 family RNA polymerase sigma factor [Paraliomyxa miuraensis]
MTNDEALFEAWCGGDQPSGEALFERYFGALHRFFHNKLGSSTEADDLVQRAFLGCVEARERFRGDASFRSYLFGIAHNTLLMHFRGRRRKQDPIDFGTVSVLDLGTSPSIRVGRREQEQVLLAALRRLPLELQVVLELSYWESMSSAEIGEALELPAGTVRSRLRRARALLEAAIEALAHTPAVALETARNLEAWARSVRDQL